MTAVPNAGKGFAVCAGAGFGKNVGPAQYIAVTVRRLHRRQRSQVLPIDQLDGRVIFVIQVCIAPLHHRHKDRHQGLPLVSLSLRSPLLVLISLSFQTFRV